MNLSQMNLEQFASIVDLLAWIISAGGAMWLFGKLEARVLENWVIWHNFPAWVKKGVPPIFAALLSFGAGYLINIDVSAFLPESFQYILMATINYYMSQLEYGRIKESAYGESSREEAELVG